MGKISNNELAIVLIERKRLSKKNASRFVNELFNVIRQGLMNERLVKVKGLGTFKIIDVDDRESVNVNTGERVLIESHSKISFIPDTLMKELVNKPFSQFETVVLKEGVDFEDVPEVEEPVIEKEPIAEPGPVAEPEPIVEEEPIAEEESVVEPEPASFYVDDIEPSTAPLVEFVTPDDLPEEMPEEIVEEMPEENVEDKSEEEVVEDKAQEETVEEKIEDKPEVVVEEADVKADEKVEETEETEGVESTLYDFEEEESSFQWKKWTMIAALCCVCFVGGYLVGRHFATEPVATPVAQSEVKPVTQSKVQSKVQPEVQPEVKPEEMPEVKPEPQAEAKPEVKPEPKPIPKPEAKPEPKSEPILEAKSVVPTESAASLDKYEKMDIRVRTGAYRIIGTDHLEKVKAGDNLSRICKRTIGAGMECYLEVYNGINSDTELKAGQQIKIPKLELKKKKAKLAN